MGLQKNRNHDQLEIILASQSPFRKHALDILGLPCDTIPSNVDETAIRHDDPRKLVQLLAEAKCKKVAESHTDALIISADLFIVFDGQIFEKPKSENEAKEMLRIFSGNSFEIVSGLAVLNSRTGLLLEATESSKITFRDLIDLEINDYVSRYDVLKFAGAFDADGLLRFAKHIEGNYNFKAGLPVNKLIEFLRKNEIRV